MKIVKCIRVEIIPIRKPDESDARNRINNLYNLAIAVLPTHGPQGTVALRSVIVIPRI